MVDDPLVVVDGADTAGPASKSLSGATPWVWVGLLLTAALALLVLSSRPDVPTAVDDASLIEVPRGPEASEVRLGAVVTGLRDAFVGLAWTRDGELRRVLWPSTRGAVIGTLDTGISVEGAGTAFDVSGLFLAVAGSDLETGDPTLLIGRHTGLAPAAGAITSLAWHDTEPGTLGFTTETEEGTSIWRVISNFPPTETSMAGPKGWQVAAWGEWGYAMQSGEEVLLLTPDAEVKASRHGRVIGSSRDGWVLIDADHLELVSAGGGVRAVDIDADRLGELRSSSFAPDGEAVAIVGTKGVLVSPLHGEGETIELSGDEMTQVVWSSDSRFLFVAMEPGIMAFDLETVNRYRILDDYTFQSLALIPSDQG